MRIQVIAVLFLICTGCLAPKKVVQRVSKQKKVKTVELCSTIAICMKKVQMHKDQSIRFGNKAKKIRKKLDKAKIGTKVYRERHMDLMVALHNAKQSISQSLLYIAYAQKMITRAKSQSYKIAYDKRTKGTKR